MTYNDFETEFFKLIEEDLDEDEREAAKNVAETAWMAMGRALINTKSKIIREEN